MIRSEGDPKTDDIAENEAYNYAGSAYNFYKSVLGRNSLDDHGMTLISSVHFGRRYNNAFWSEQMCYGDGDGRISIRFTKSGDGLPSVDPWCGFSHLQLGVFKRIRGAERTFCRCVWLARQTVAQAANGEEGRLAYRGGHHGTGYDSKVATNVKAEKAYENDPLLGTDPQPKHLKNKYNGSADNGGVHINSGIPNLAFYLTAMEIGGKHGKRPGRFGIRHCSSSRP